MLTMEIPAIFSTHPHPPDLSFFTGGQPSIKHPTQRASTDSETGKVPHLFNTTHNLATLQKPTKPRANTSHHAMHLP
jgi:hypothetical protein